MATDYETSEETSPPTKKPADYKEVKVLGHLKLPEEDFDKPKKGYCPEGFDKVEDYLSDLRKTYEADLEADQENRDNALEDKQFIAGDQWDPQVLKAREGLPCLKINTIPQFIAQLVGDWRENRISVKVLPSEAGDQDVADIRSDLIRSIETKSRADRIFNDTFESMVQCGDGAFKISVDYAADDVFDQDIVLRPIDDALSVVWDRLSVDPTGRDARRAFVDDLIPREEFERQWPDCDPSLLGRKEKKELTSSGWIDDHSVRVTEHWRMLERKTLLVMFEDGTIYSFEENVDPEKIDKFIADHGPMKKARYAPCRFAQMHLVTGFKILAGPYEYRLDRLPIIRMSGRTVSMGESRVRYGLVRFMKDAIRLKNFWRSTAAEQLGYAPKAQWMATESAVAGREKTIREAHLTRDPLMVFNDEAEFGRNVQRVDPPPMQQALLNESQMNTQDMKDITGIHDASLGIKSNETSGRAIMARQREGDVASLTYYDNGNAAVLEAGDVINQLLGQIYDGTRIVRLIGEDEATKLVTINDPMNPDSPNLAVGKYDVAMTTGASYTTRRVEAAEAMMEAIQVFPQMMEIAGDLVVKAQDWPGADELSERMKKTINPALLSDKEKAEMGEQAPDMQAIMQQQAMAQEHLQKMSEQLEKLEMENLSLKTREAIEMQKLELDKQRLVLEEFEAETNRIKVYGDIQVKQQAQGIQASAQELQAAEKAANFAMQAEERESQLDQAERDRVHELEKQMNDQEHQSEQAAAAAEANSGAQNSTPSAE
jgi:hypothetical protein